MPKIVREITSGGSNERSAESGAVADTSVRNWRIVLSEPSENYNIQQAIGVRIGDPHPANTNLPCVSFSERAEGDSRVVRLVTATYKSTPGGDPQEDPNKQQPDIRPAKFTISSSLIETPANRWKPIEDMDVPFADPKVGNEQDATNPVGDRYEGVVSLGPLITISIEQFDNFPTSRLVDVGSLNADEFRFLGLTIAPFTCMLRGVNVRPTVESFGELVYRGFTRSFEFVVKPSGDGWLIRQIVEGFNIKNTGFGRADVWNEGLVLKHKDGKVVDPPSLATEDGKKVRAVIPIHSLEGGWMQRPSAQPVALNSDGTPRDVESENPPVLTELYTTQNAVQFGDNFANMGVRIREII